MKKTTLRSRQRSRNVDARRAADVAVLVRHRSASLRILEASMPPQRPRRQGGHGRLASTAHALSKREASASGKAAPAPAGHAPARRHSLGRRALGRHTAVKKGSTSRARRKISTSAASSAAPLP